MKNKKWTKEEIIVSLREMEKISHDKNKQTEYFLIQIADSLEHGFIDTNEYKKVIEAEARTDEVTEIIEKKLLPYKKATIAYQKPLIEKIIYILDGAIEPELSVYDTQYMISDKDEIKKKKAIKTLEAMLINNDLDQWSNNVLKEMTETIKYASNELDSKEKVKEINNKNNKLLKEVILILQQKLDFERMLHEKENLIYHHDLEEILILLEKVFKNSNDFLWERAREKNN